MSDWETTVKKGEEPLVPQEQDPVYLNKQYVLVADILRSYIDSRFADLDPKLLETAAQSAPPPQLSIRGQGRWIWRFDLYFLAALLLLAFIGWKTWTAAPMAEHEGDRTTVAAPGDEAGSGSAQDPTEKAVLEALDRYRADAYFLVALLLMCAVLWRLHSLNVALREVRALAATPREAPVIWTSPPVEKASAVPSLPPAIIPIVKPSRWSRWRRWVPGTRQWNYRPWSRLLRDDRPRVVDWIQRLAISEGLDSSQTVREVEETAAGWRRAVENGHDLSDRDTEDCVRTLFQYFYARWVTEERQRDRKARKQDLPRVTGKAGAVKDGIDSFLQARGLALNVEKPDPENPKLQMAVVDHYLRVRSR